MAKAFDRLAVEFACQEFRSHPAVARCGEPTFSAAGASVELEVDLQFGSRWAARGRSPTGVQPREQIRIDFPPAFPSAAPEVSLRPDFSRDHPHVQPWLTADGRVVPCLVDGDVCEFLAARGYRDLVDQLVLWLNRAAEDRLMDGGPWEPSRRDTYLDILASNAEQLRKLVSKKSGFEFFRTSYCTKWGAEFTPLYFGALGPATTALEKFEETRLDDSDYAQGKGLALVVWSAPGTNHLPTVCDEYLPDDVGTAGDLLARAKEFGVDGSLAAALKLLRQKVSSLKPNTFPLPIVMLVRRPRRVAGSSTNIEILGYLTSQNAPDGPLQDPTLPVRPLAHRDALEPGLLRRMSGDEGLPNWALLGCGSLGSKVAMHAARSGNGPMAVVDKDYFDPHNAARHALYPAPGNDLFGWHGEKAGLLADALRPFGVPVTAIKGTHLDLADRIRGMSKSKRPGHVVNTTASLVAREVLATMPLDEMPPVVEMTLFDGGRLGYMAIEGSNRNPNAVELAASLYQRAAFSAELGRHLFDPAESINRIAIGQGCGSLTMIVSDASMSVMAGAMSEAHAGLGVSGHAGLQLFRREGLGLAHETIVVPPFHRVAMEGLEGWSVSVAENVYQRMLEEMARYPAVETGGVLVGWSSLIARQVIVTDLIPAPADSVRQPTKFVLGTAGLSETIGQFEARSLGLLRCLGTWHSHLGSSAPSGLDQATAVTVAASTVGPTALLILVTDGMRAISRGPSAA